MTANSPQSGLEFDPSFIERERNRLAGRALSFLIALNGVAALILLAIMAQAPEGTVDRKVAAAMLFFASGAVAALFSSFLAYLGRTVRLEAPRRSSLPRTLRGLAIAAVIASGASFLIGMNMVATSQAERASSHPKGHREDKPRKRPAIKNASFEPGAAMRSSRGEKVRDRSTQKALEDALRP